MASMVSLDSRVRWDLFSLDDWLAQHETLTFIVNKYKIIPLEESYQDAAADQRHVLIETLNILLTLTTDKDIILCAYLSFVIDKNFSDITKHYPDLPLYVQEMLSQYHHLERILETVAVAGTGYKEHIRKMLLVTVDDPRLVVIMLSKVLAILRHPYDYDDQYIISLSKMSLEIFAPIAHRLGIGQIKWEMEDHSFHLLYPEAYQSISKELAQSRGQRESFIAAIKQEVKSLLEAQYVQSTVTGRSKHFYSIWKKMNKKNKPFSQIYDLNAIRIIVDSVQDCYRALGIIHTQWRYLPEEFDDYIANPKINGYQSIHTAVFGPQQRIIEVQVRTLEMDKNAELGIAAHWMYKDGAQQHQSYQHKLETLRNFLQRANVSSHESFENVKDEIFGDRTYVFTPKGDVYDLPKGSTALDLAYHIHSELGHHCSGARIQGKMIPLTEPLSTGLVVEINTSARVQPSRDWLNPHYGYIKTARARQKVAHWFRSLDKGRLVQEGKAYFDKQLKRLGLHGTFSVEDLVHKLSFKSKDDLYHALALGDLKLSRILDYFDNVPKINEQASTVKENTKTITHHEISFGNMSSDDVKYDYACCCSPVYPNPIVGLITRGRGVIVHRRDCLNLKVINQVHDRLMFAQWARLACEYQSDSVLLQITAIDQQNVVNNITGVLLEFGVVMSHLKSERSSQEQLIIITVVFEINSLAELHRLIDRIHQLNCIIEVERLLTVNQ
ncbi:bifunctional (p)ppGpp synthetase/guanosine-3',5'-bis(diphosphate) 3'-pyrophosphohydrolase [bacterium]|nr:bifunctional (p)ppGpp synthetase/guanosine-3',5'-bis(diphosphate) 3'-pyrophosphohydrolase [bacterium]NBW56673.1 bifunctional (p)ppGpp synthetase/guanosine-3',5'-bis(diphosphate) 3'-pyrophosphohydrolase [bacterium]NBX72042.1 bifunctional (p)ppGpp synthetase/guanosine-3',5'-bis(diphosphate) 3'-pyrophosphohydrolase [bacterium]